MPSAPKSATMVVTLTRRRCPPARLRSGGRRRGTRRLHVHGVHRVDRRFVKGDGRPEREHTALLTRIRPAAERLCGRAARSTCGGAVDEVRRPGRPRHRGTDGGRRRPGAVLVPPLTATWRQRGEVRAVARPMPLVAPVTKCGPAGESGMVPLSGFYGFGRAFVDQDQKSRYAPTSPGGLTISPRPPLE